MFTRKDYLSGNCTHEEYYNQFVNNHIKNIVEDAFSLEYLKKSFKEDQNFNNIALAEWDNLTNYFNCNKKMQELKDYSTLAGKVCILKATAKILITE